MIHNLIRRLKIRGAHCCCGTHLYICAGAARGAARHAAFFTPLLPPRSSVSARAGFTPAVSTDSRCYVSGTGRPVFSPLMTAGPAAAAAAPSTARTKNRPKTAATAKKPRASAKKPSTAVTRKGAAAATKTAPDRGKEGSKRVLVIVESPAKARTITALLQKAAGGGGMYKGYTVDACNGHVTDLVSKRKDIPPELKARTKGWDIVGVDVVSYLSSKEMTDRMYVAAAGGVFFLVPCFPPGACLLVI